jgi:hypothetical protein
VLQAGSCVDAMILENGDMSDTRIKTELVIASLINAQHIGHMAVRQEAHGLGVVGGFYDDVMNSKTLNGAAGTVNSTCGRNFTSQCSELVRHDSNFP